MNGRAAWEEYEIMAIDWQCLGCCTITTTVVVTAAATAAPATESIIFKLAGCVPASCRPSRAHT